LKKLIQNNKKRPKLKVILTHSTLGVSDGELHRVDSGDGIDLGSFLKSRLLGEVTESGVHVAWLELVSVAVERYTTSGFAEGLLEVVLSNHARSRGDFGVHLLNK
jgi:hypothetical protein